MPNPKEFLEVVVIVVVVVVLVVIGVASRRQQKRLEAELEGLRDSDTEEQD